MLEEPPILRIRRDFPRPTAAQIEAFRGVPTGFVCDAMNGAGSLDTAIAPIGAATTSGPVVGTAVVADNGPAEILATMAALSLVQEGDILLSAVHGYQGTSACGDLILGMMKNNGVAAFVTDGPMRDVEGIEEVGLPAWCTGLNPNSPYSKGPGAVGDAAVIGGQRVASGDIIVADRSGVVVIPHAKIDETIKALEAVKAAEVAFEAKVKGGAKSFFDLD
ncbi:MAG: RraA family protein, partial [Pseudomonadota bacterium]|nr:RraA family protein [Pseudomonadota bacterium]